MFFKRVKYELGTISYSKKPFIKALSLISGIDSAFYYIHSESINKKKYSPRERRFLSKMSQIDNRQEVGLL